MQMGADAETNIHPLSWLVLTANLTEPTIAWEGSPNDELSRSG